jgi:hypothetical protein
VAGGADAGSAMDVDADVPSLGHLGLACVQPHPDPHGVRGERLLSQANRERLREVVLAEIVTILALRPVEATIPSALHR